MASLLQVWCLYVKLLKQECTSFRLVLSCLFLVLQGTILIAVNPLQKVADPDMSEFMNRSLDPEAPHPYAIAEVG